MSLVNAYLSNCLTPGIQRTYDLLHAEYAAWCKEENMPVFQSADSAIGWIAKDVLPRRPGRMEMAFAMIREIHEARGFASPTDEPKVRAFRRGARRKLAESRGPKNYKRSEPKRYRKLKHSGTNYRDARASAMLACVRWGGASPRHLIDALRERTFIEPDGIRIEFDDPLFPECLVGRTGDACDPARDIEDYLRLRGDRPGPLFDQPKAHSTLPFDRVYFTRMFREIAKRSNAPLVRVGIISTVLLLDEQTYHHVITQPRDDLGYLRFAAAAAIVRTGPYAEEVAALDVRDVKLVGAEVRIAFADRLIRITDKESVHALGRYITVRGKAAGALFPELWQPPRRKAVLKRKMRAKAGILSGSICTYLENLGVALSEQRDSASIPVRMSSHEFERALSVLGSSPRDVLIGAALPMRRAGVTDPELASLHRKSVEYYGGQVRVTLADREIVIRDALSVAFIVQYLEQRGDEPGFLFRELDVFAGRITHPTIEQDLDRIWDHVSSEHLTPRDHRASFISDALTSFGPTLTTKLMGFTLSSAIERYGGVFPKDPKERYFARVARRKRSEAKRRKR